MAAGFQKFRHTRRNPESIGMDSYPSVGPEGPPDYMFLPRLAGEEVFWWGADH